MKVETPIAQIIRAATEKNANSAENSETNDNQKKSFRCFLQANIIY